MPAAGARKDHQAIAFFRVEIDSIDGASFRKCSGLKTETEIFEYQEGGANDFVHKLVGATKHSNITLTQGFVSDPALFKWREEIHNGGANAIKRRNGAIIAIAADGKTEVGRWNFEKAWPVKWEMSDFEAANGQAACEILELAVSKLSRGK